MFFSALVPGDKALRLNASVLVLHVLRFELQRLAIELVMSFNFPLLSARWARSVSGRIFALTAPESLAKMLTPVAMRMINASLLTSGVAGSAKSADSAPNRMRGFQD